jgi:hypothetical protein
MEGICTQLNIVETSRVSNEVICFRKDVGKGNLDGVT